uniref:Uncharacterized protein n=1 Tax=Lepeophtheirus salmonis TaxID=72036 RepID=A0A0K2UU84_LEPSM
MISFGSKKRGELTAVVPNCLKGNDAAWKLGFKDVGGICSLCGQPFVVLGVVGMLTHPRFLK